MASVPWLLLTAAWTTSSSAIVAPPCAVPTALSSAGPTVIGSRGPIRWASAPERADRASRISVMGTLARPAIKDAERLFKGYVEAKKMTALFPVLLKATSTLRRA